LLIRELFFLVCELHYWRLVGSMSYREPVDNALLLFQMLDGDNDGVITSAEFHRGMCGRRKGELRELLERSAPRGLDWQELLERIDVNNDGKITWQEFDQAVRSGNAVWHEMGQPHGETTPSVAIGAFGEFEVSPSSPHMLPS